MAPTSLISLKETPVDAMAISFYKMFGYPTGVGALVVKKTFLAQLRRPWFAGGTGELVKRLNSSMFSAKAVDVVQVPGKAVTMAPQLHEQFEVRALLILATSIADFFYQ